MFAFCCQLPLRPLWMMGQLHLPSWAQMARRWKGAKLKRQSCPTRGGGRSSLTVSTTVRLCLKPLRRTTTEVRRVQVPAYQVCKFILMRRNNKAAKIFFNVYCTTPGEFHNHVICFQVPLKRNTSRRDCSTWGALDPSILANASQTDCQ